MKNKTFKKRKKYEREKIWKMPLNIVYFKQ